MQSNASVGSSDLSRVASSSSSADSSSQHRSTTALTLPSLFSSSSPPILDDDSFYTLLRHYTHQRQGFKELNVSSSTLLHLITSAALLKQLRGVRLSVEVADQAEHGVVELSMPTALHEATSSFICAVVGEGISAVMEEIGLQKWKYLYGTGCSRVTLPTAGNGWVSKEPDASWTPMKPVVPAGTASTKTPTVVVEIGWSEGLRGLKPDQNIWLADRDGQLSSNVVILASLSGQSGDDFLTVQINVVAKGGVVAPQFPRLGRPERLTSCSSPPSRSNPNPKLQWETLCEVEFACDGTLPPNGLSVPFQAFFRPSDIPPGVNEKQEVRITAEELQMYSEIIKVLWVEHG